MSQSVNNVILIGNLGRDPELRQTTSGIPVCNISIATSEKWKSADGEDRERTEWHEIVVWRSAAEFLAQYARKGSQVYVEGRIQSSDYTDKTGAERQKKQIVASRVVLLGQRGDSSQSEPRRSDDQYNSPSSQPVNAAECPDDDIPF
jgi:single-strand DNA-binding protein